MDDPDVDATMEAAFNAAEAQITALEQMAAVWRWRADRTQAERVERRLSLLREQLAQRREAWTTNKQQEQ